MPLPTNFTTTFIPGTACIGDSRQTINTNFNNVLSAANYIHDRAVSTASYGSTMPLTTLVGVISAFNASGTYLGYVPVYK